MLSVICAGTSWRRTGPQAEIYFLQQAERARHLGWSADTKTKTLLYFLQPIVSILDLGLPLAYSIILLYILFLKFRFSGKDLISAPSRGFLMQYLPEIKNLCKILMQYSSKKWNMDVYRYIWILRKGGTQLKYFPIPWIPRHCFEAIHLNNIAPQYDFLDSD